MNRYENLKILDELREKGSITEEEFLREKAKILNGMPPPPPPPPPNLLPFSSDKRFVVLMHLSQFVLGITIPLIMWLIGKDRSLVIDQHGKNIVNFLISYFLYTVASVWLIFFTLFISMIPGTILLVVLAILMPIFIIIATIKAANGEAWKYPLSIEFIK